MEGIYDVMLGSTKMGSVRVHKEKLYWVFSCSCTLCGEVMYDLMLRVEDAVMKLGLLTPGAGNYELHTKLPVKRVGQGSPIFTLQPRHDAMQGHFLVVDPQTPFAYLHRLETAYLARQNGKIGVVIDNEKI